MFISVQKQELEGLQDIVLEAREKGFNVELGSSEEEIRQLSEALKADEEGLTYSNDSTIDMIIKKTLLTVEEDGLLKLLEEAHISNQLEPKAAYTYPFSADKYRVVIGQPFLKAMQQVSDIAGISFFVSQELPAMTPESKAVALCLGQYVSILTECLLSRTNEDERPESWRIQGNLKLLDESCQQPFTDVMVYFGREIYEMAVAFVVGHEIGHQYLGHLRSNRSSDDEGNAPYNKEWEKEYLADAFGVKFAVRYMNRSMEEGNSFDFLYGQNRIFERKDYRLLGIPVAFLASEYYSPNAVGGDERHPPLEYREERMWKNLEGLESADLVNTVEKEFAFTKKMILFSKEQLEHDADES